MSRIVHISNRVVTDPEKASGGLDNTIKSCPGFDQIVRIGWSGVLVDDKDFKKNPENFIHVSKCEFMDREFEFVVVDAPKNMFAGFYNSTANELIWALTHRRAGLMQSDKESRQHYIKWNKIIAGIAAEHINPSDKVMVHDYHHMPLGQDLRRKGVDNAIGIMMHTPLIEQSTIERAKKLDSSAANFAKKLFTEDLFYYDMVGIQAPRDVAEWQKVMGADPSQIVTANPYERHVISNGNGKHTIAMVAPAVGDFDYNRKIARDNMKRPEILKFMSEVFKDKRRKLPDLVSGDRVDHSKGLPMKMAAIRVAIEEMCVKPKDIHLLQAVQWGRDAVNGYREERQETEEAYTKLRRDFGNVAYIPYFKGQGMYEPEGTELRGLPQEILFSMYAYARGGMFTSKIDGQHLGPCEFYACTRPEDPGVPILTNTCGAAVPFREAAIIVEPNEESIAKGIVELKEMSKEERKARYEKAMEVIHTNTNERWLTELVKATDEGYKLRLDPS